MNPLTDPRCFSPGHETPDLRKTKSQAHPFDCHDGYIDQDMLRCACGQVGWSHQFWTATECAACHERKEMKCQSMKQLDSEKNGVSPQQNKASYGTETTVSSLKTAQSGSSSKADGCTNAQANPSSQPESEPQERDGWVKNQHPIVNHSQWAPQGDFGKCRSVFRKEDGHWETTLGDETFTSWPALKAALEAKGA